MITLAQAKSWHPCHGAPGQKYDGPHLEQLFAGEPATWHRVASWDIERGDVIWLATRPGALEVMERRALLKGVEDEPVAQHDSEAWHLFCDLTENLDTDMTHEALHLEREAACRERAATWRTIGEVGWYLATLADAHAARLAARASGLWAASLAWEACMVAEWSGAVSWERQVELLLGMVE